MLTNDGRTGSDGRCHARYPLIPSACYAISMFWLTFIKIACLPVRREYAFLSYTYRVLSVRLTDFLCHFKNRLLDQPWLPLQYCRAIPLIMTIDITFWKTPPHLQYNMQKQYLCNSIHSTLSCHDSPFNPVIQKRNPSTWHPHT